MGKNIIIGIVAAVLAGTVVLVASQAKWTVAVNELRRERDALLRAEEELNRALAEQEPLIEDLRARTEQYLGELDSLRDALEGQQFDTASAIKQSRQWEEQLEDELAMALVEGDEQDNAIATEGESAVKGKNRARILGAGFRDFLDESRLQSTQPQEIERLDALAVYSDEFQALRQALQAEENEIEAEKIRQELRGVAKEVGALVGQQQNAMLHQALRRSGVRGKEQEEKLSRALRQMVQTPWFEDRNIRHFKGPKQKKKKNAANPKR
jgi:hypothetical protein